MNRVFYRLIMMLTLCSAAQADIVKTVDENGRVTYTDNPAATQNTKTEKVELPVINTTPATPVRSWPKSKPNDHSGAPNRYSIEITSPSEGLQVPMGQQQVSASASLEPALHEKHRLQFYINNSKHGKASQQTSVTLDNLYRGELKIHAAVVTLKGKLVSKSKPVTIFVQRRSLNTSPSTKSATPTPQNKSNASK